MQTEFALAERATAQTLAEDIMDVKDLPLVVELTDVLADAFIILNFHRQIVYCNPSLVDQLKLSGPEEIYGLRPGEALNCIHSKTTEGGCGTTAYCRYCGAVNAVLSSQENPGRTTQRECRLAVGEANQSFDFKIRASTLLLMDRRFTLVVIQDIGAEKRRNILERLFFHDILNTAGGIQGVIELMQEATEDELGEFLALAAESTQTLLEEINAQRDLLVAERGELITEALAIDSLELLGQVRDLYKNHPTGRGKTIRIHPDAGPAAFASDPKLLTRILGHMLKNALEAESAGATITLGAQGDGREIELWVMNPSAMPEEVRMQVFRRSFSTKGKGRGIGTYSLKLLGETYLKGEVGFTSAEDGGTRFFIRLPIGV